MSELDKVKEELSATKLLLRQEIIRSEEAIELAKHALNTIKKTNNELVLLRMKRKGLKIAVK